ncbi:hypothetical protein NMG60_11032741 [Bertholletia excelsa]
MKIQCNVCEVAEANVFCCADEAALCLGCDHKVHAANKLASNHQRIPLSSSSAPKPKCDTCQETIAHFFCLEDRALLCRRCDVNMHGANSYVSAHRRFLLTGITVGLEATELGGSSSKNLNKPDKVVSPRYTSGNGSPVPANVQPEAVPSHLNAVGNPVTMQTPLFVETTPNSIPECDVHGCFGLTNSNQNSESINYGSKDDGGGVGGCLWSRILQSVEEGLYGDESSNHDPNNLRRVPQKFSQTAVSDA